MAPRRIFSLKCSTVAVHPLHCRHNYAGAIVRYTGNTQWYSEPGQMSQFKLAALFPTKYRAFCSVFEVTSSAATTKLLLECGSSGDIDGDPSVIIECRNRLKQVLPGISAIILSNAALPYCGLLPMVASVAAELGISVPPIYGTLPVCKLSVLQAIEYQQSLRLDWFQLPAEGWYSDQDITAVARAQNPLAWAAPATVGQLSLTAFPAGGSVGAACWLIQPDDCTSVVYAPQFSCAGTQYSTDPGVFYFGKKRDDELSSTSVAVAAARPHLVRRSHMLIDAMPTLRSSALGMLPGYQAGLMTHSQRQKAFAERAFNIVNQRRSVLVPVDLATTAIEVLGVLEAYAQEHDSEARPQIVLVANTADQLVSRCQQLPGWFTSRLDPPAADENHNLLDNVICANIHITYSANGAQTISVVAHSQERAIMPPAIFVAAGADLSRGPARFLAQALSNRQGSVLIWPSDVMNPAISRTSPAARLISGTGSTIPRFIRSEPTPEERARFDRMNEQLRRQAQAKIDAIRQKIESYQHKQQAEAQREALASELELGGDLRPLMNALLSAEPLSEELQAQVHQRFIQGVARVPQLPQVVLDDGIRDVLPPSVSASGEPGLDAFTPKGSAGALLAPDVLGDADLPASVLGMPIHPKFTGEKEEELQSARGDDEMRRLTEVLMREEKSMSMLTDHPLCGRPGDPMAVNLHQLLIPLDAQPSVLDFSGVLRQLAPQSIIALGDSWDKTALIKASQDLRASLRSQPDAGEAPLALPLAGQLTVTTDASVFASLDETRHLSTFSAEYNPETEKLMPSAATTASFDLHADTGVSISKLQEKEVVTVNQLAPGVGVYMLGDSSVLWQRPMGDEMIYEIRGNYGSSLMQARGVVQDVLPALDAAN